MTSQCLLPASARSSRQRGPTTVPFIGGGFLTEPTCQKTHVVCCDARAPIQNRRRCPGTSESRSPYEPQTTFPAFTVVLIFMAFFLLPEIADRPGLRQ